MIQTIIIEEANLLPNRYYAFSADDSIYQYEGDTMKYMNK